jgi:hypothetical protein
MKAAVVSVAVIIGLAFIALAALYWLTPAGELPAFLPGYVPESTKPPLQPRTWRPDYWIGGARPRLVPQQSRLGLGARPVHERRAARRAVEEGRGAQLVALSPTHDVWLTQQRGRRLKTLSLLILRQLSA